MGNDVVTHGRAKLVVPSYCIEQKKPYCHYKPKPLKKPTAAPPASARRRSRSSSTSSDGHGAAIHLAGAADVAAHGGSQGLLTGPGRHRVAMVPGLMPLKRCRLSASPATGLLGLPENMFLGDFFGCLGVLPLATESTIRRAMVETMMEAVGPLQQHEKTHCGNSMSAIGGDSYQGAGPETLLAEGGEKSCHDASVLRDVPNHPARCIMWCAIALGSLMRGSPVKNVARYIGLARESIAECFDEHSVENARAHLMMSFLHGIIRDKEKNERYLSFVMNIVAKLAPDEVPKDLGAMLLTAEEARIFQAAGDRTTVDTVFANYGNLADLPLVRDVMEQNDVCNMVLRADRRFMQAFATDMCLQGGLHVKGQAGLGGEGVQTMGDSNTSPWDDAMAGTHDERSWGTRAPLPSWNDPSLVNSWNTGQEPPPPGSFTSDYIEEIMPELLRLSKPLGRSDTCSGVGGLIYYGMVAYMSGVSGDLPGCIGALESSTNVFSRYPGAVRFRPHLAHCTLAACYNFSRQDLYDVMREIYNLNRPVGCPMAPPFEEWTGIPQICDHVFCRSVHVEGDILLQGHGAEGEFSYNDGSQAAESSGRSLSSPSIDSSWAGPGSQSSASPLEGPWGQQHSSPAAAVTDSAASATLPSSEVPSELLRSRALHDDGMAMGGTFTAEQRLASFPHFTEANDFKPDEFVTQRAPAGQQHSGVAAAIPEGDPTAKLDQTGETPGSGQGEMSLTDADFLDIATMFNGEEEQLLEL